jgi:hypothetical protein
MILRLAPGEGHPRCGALRRLDDLQVTEGEAKLQFSFALSVILSCEAPAASGCPAGKGSGGSPDDPVNLWST